MRAGGRPRLKAGLAIAAGVVAVILGTALGFAPAFLEALVHPPAIIRAALIGASVAIGVILLARGLVAMAAGETDIRRFAIVSGWLLAFTISLDDVVITTFTSGPGSTTLPILIWSKVKLGVTPDINALASLVILVVGTGVALAGYILYRADKRRERDIQMAIAANQ